MDEADIDISKADTVAEAFDKLANGLNMSNQLFAKLQESMQAIVAGVGPGTDPSAAKMVANLRIWAEWLRTHPDVDNQLYTISSYNMGDLAGA